MKLADLLSRLAPSELERLAVDKVESDHGMSHALLASALETVLRSYSFVQRAIVRRQPPTFSILLALLEAPACAVPESDLRAVVEATTSQICDRMSLVGSLGRETELRLYRRVLHEARRSELDLDPSETAILGVLRRELGMTHVEHFLMEHHPDLQSFWKTDGAFERELDALVRFGVIFSDAGTILLPEDQVPVIRQSVGLRLKRATHKRLLEHLAGSALTDALAAKQMKSTGTKDEKIDRLLANFVPPSDVLQHVSLHELRELARGVNCNMSGSREDLAERLVDHFDRDCDLAQSQTEEPAPLPNEPRELDESRFRMLFTRMSGQHLADILCRHEELRQSGSKDQRVTTLWNSRFSERSLLDDLTGRDLEDILYRCDLRIAGAKSDKIERLMAHFKALDPAIAVSSESMTPTAAPEPSDVEEH